jgi:uncharacterized protein
MTDTDRRDAEADLKYKILNEYPRLSEQDAFEFACNPGVSCFTDCCRDVNIVLTPYDVVRMKNRLGIGSREFLDEYTVTIASKEMQLPVVMFKLSDDAEKRCRFVTEKGCGIYEDRPWPCRMYPLGMASPSDDHIEIAEPFYFLMREDVCKGFAECGGKQWTVGRWMTDQGVAVYNEMGELWKEVTLHRFFAQGGELDPAKMDMLFMATYDLDLFRPFIFETSFLKKFEVDPEEVEAMRTDDAALLRFACRWVRFACFRDKTMTIRGEIAEAFRRQAEREAAAKQAVKDDNADR